MTLPFITLRLDNDMYGFPNEGTLTYQYNPFRNLQNPNPTPTNPALTDLSINSSKAGINITEPITIDTEVSYDDSINLVITDRVNPPKIVNSRFYQTSTMTYEVADRKGNLDTNIYSENNFKVETGLIKSVRTITTVDFLGIKDGGSMSIGNYTFYFRLADADGNESDFIAESGKVICHIGAVNFPKSIRGGQQDENSNKLIKFKLKNLDLAYDYINIYYTRSTGDGDQEILKTYKITDKFKITNNDVEISITGYENHEEIAIEDINIQYANFDSVSTLANCQNITFAGNITNDYNLFKTLEKYSLFVTPQVVYDEDGIGNLNHLYNETYTDRGYEYYNAKNVYYKLGYWDEEIYRLGIVYVLNDYTLSPVFNIRGRKTIDINTIYTHYNLDGKLNCTENYLLEGTKYPDNPENVKGVFKIDCSTKLMFSGTGSIRPIGLKFDFMSDVIDGDGSFIPGLKDLTKGFFIVRQKRIPTILAQGLGIATSKNGHIPVIQGTNTKKGITNSFFAESFLYNRVSNSVSESVPVLGPELFKVPDVIKNALLCPEAHIRRKLFNTFFNSSEYTLKTFKYRPNSLVFSCFDEDSKNFSFKGLIAETGDSTVNQSELTLIEPGIDLIRNNKFDFCSRAGNGIIPYKFVDPKLGDYENVENSDPTEAMWNNTTTKVRGDFNTFVGTSTSDLVHGKYYNILQKDYDFDSYWKDYFNVRYNDASPFFPISDRISWDKLTLAPPSDWGTTLYYSGNFFRGDCYINTYTHRMHWNFIDSEMPTNKKIIDPYTWARNFKIKKKASVIVNDAGEPGTSTLTYNKLLKLFTYKNVFEQEWSGHLSTDGAGEVVNGLIEPDGKKFEKYSTRNGLFGAEKMNKPDVNAVPIGHWATFKICSNINLAMRDLDWTQPMEEAVHKIKRGFYPLQPLDPKNALPESNIINSGLSKSTSDKYYFEIPDVPFIKTNFATRIHYSNILQSSTFTNGNRIFESTNYQDYTKEYGAIVKLIEWYGALIAVMEHGVIMIPVNERAAMTNATGENVYINTDTVLPKNPKVLSNSFGSLWPESIIKTPRYVYGIDTVGKKIWRTNGEVFENISDMKIQKFLNDHILLKESDKDRTINTNFVKSHYNAFKQDLLFTFRYNNVLWNLCWNELTERWVTQYTWFPEFSENINNIFYTFANQTKHLGAGNKLYKHGFAGTEEELGNIKPTYWYGEQHPFEYEFVVGEIPGVQKIFNNLNIVSNLAEPDSLFYEVVGEGFDWFKYKSLIMQLNDTTQSIIDGVSMSGIPKEKTEINVQARYKQYLSVKTDIKKLPYIYAQSFNINDADSFYRDRTTLTPPFNMSVLKDLTLREHNKTKERLVNIYQKGADIKKYGRVKGNMQYLEDAWNIQIQPISFSYAYLSNGNLSFTSKSEMKIRDKYIKIRIKYKGDEYAIINALRTLFTISYA